MNTDLKKILSDECWKASLPDILVATLLAVALFPGFLLNIPPVPAQDVGGQTGFWKRTWNTGVVTPWNVVVHGLIFALLFGLYKMATCKKVIEKGFNVLKKL